jgi:peptidyl-prolyl cis-trans isomerase D
VSSWYNSHKLFFNQPEHRVIRYAVFDDSVAKNVAAPTDAEIAQRYNTDKAQYQASETRKISQLILPTEAAAKALSAELAKGTAMEAAAKARGLSVASVGPVDKATLAAQTSQAVADAAFAAPKGVLPAPVKGLLGYGVVRVDDIVVKPARTLDQAKGEIAAALLADKRKAALASVTSKIDDSFSKGGALSDAAKELGVNLFHPGAQRRWQRLWQHRAEGSARAGQGRSGRLRHGARACAPARRAGAGQEVPDVRCRQHRAGRPAAARPREARRGRRDPDGKGRSGRQECRAARARQDEAWRRAGCHCGGLGVKLPPVQSLSLGREQLRAQQGQLPPAMGLFFSMAKGSTKLLPLPGGRGWLVVQLKDITTTPVDAKDPLVADAKRELASLQGREYGDALRRAMRADVGATRNDAAIGAVAKQLAGGN